MQGKDWLTTLFVINTAKRKETCLPVSLSHYTWVHQNGNSCSIELWSCPGHWLHASPGYEYMFVCVCLSQSLCVWPVSSEDWAEFEGKLNRPYSTWTHTYTRCLLCLSCCWQSSQDVTQEWFPSSFLISSCHSWKHHVSIIVAYRAVNYLNHWSIYPVDTPHKLLLLRKRFDVLHYCRLKAVSRTSGNTWWALLVFFHTSRSNEQLVDELADVNLWNCDSLLSFNSSKTINIFWFQLVERVEFGGFLCSVRQNRTSERVVLGSLN